MNNVTNVLRKSDPGTSLNNYASRREKAAQTEFLAMTEINLREGKILDYVRFTSGIFIRVFLKQTMSSMRPYANRKTLKQFIQILIPEVESNSTSSIK